MFTRIKHTISVFQAWRAERPKRKARSERYKKNGGAHMDSGQRAAEFRKRKTQLPK